MENLFQKLEEIRPKIKTPNDSERIYLTSENSPELKAAMDKISSELLKRNKNLYRRLANVC